MSEVRKALAVSFKELVLERGFQKIIVKDITDRAGVKRPTFYTYFRDKYDVIEWIFDTEVWQPARSLVGAGYTKEALRFMLISMEKDREYYRRICVLEGQNSFQDICKKYFSQGMDTLLREEDMSEIHPLLTRGIVAEYLANMFWFVIDKWLNYGKNVSALDIMEIYELLASDSLEELLRKKLMRNEKENGQQTLQNHKNVPNK